MNCGCEWNQCGRSRAVSPVVALAVLAAPVMGAVLYMGLARGTSAPDNPVPRWGTESQSEGGGWAGLAASTLDGSSFAMADLSGKPAVLYFWATWCPQCKIQRAVLNSLSHEWSDRVRIAGLSVDDDLPSVKRYLEAHAPLTHELVASAELLRFFGVEGLPTLVVIDAKGRVQTVSSGLTDDPELRRLVAPLLP